MTRIAILTTRDAERLEECLAGNGVAVIPTDTVYGLACDPGSDRALHRIYELKRRAPLKPAAVMFFALEPALETLTELGPRAHTALEALLPGPVTVLLPNPLRRFALACDPTGISVASVARTARARVAPRSGGAARALDATLAHAPGGSGPVLLGLRVPTLPGPLEALATVRLPVAQSSANLSGGPDPSRIEDVPQLLRDGADLVLDGGRLPGTPSTVVDLSNYERTGAWCVAREGPVERSALAQLLG